MADLLGTVERTTNGLKATRSITELNAGTSTLGCDELSELSNSIMNSSIGGRLETSTLITIIRILMSAYREIIF